MPHTSNLYSNKVLSFQVPEILKGEVGKRVGGGGVGFKYKDEIKKIKSSLAGQAGKVTSEIWKLLWDSLGSCFFSSGFGNEILTF